MKELRHNNGEVEINYTRGPKNGPPLLLIHGFTRSLQTMLPMFPILSLRWEVFALDMRGHGKSGRAEKYQITDHVSDVENFIDHVIASDEPVVIIGHSMGAMVANLLAAKLPDKIRAIVLGDPPMNVPLPSGEEPPTSYASIFNAILSKNLTIEDRLDVVLNSIIKFEGEEKKASDVVSITYLLLWANELNNLDPKAGMMWNNKEDHVSKYYKREEFVPKINCPVMLLRAHKSIYITDDDVKLYRENVKPFVYKQMREGIGHMLHLDNTDEILNPVFAFLEIVR